VLALMDEIAGEKGLDAMSMRDVAKRASLSLAALQYHFPTKDALIAAFVEARLASYRNDIAAIRAIGDPTAGLRSLVLYAIDRTLDPRTDAIFAMLDARARHDPTTARAMDRFMQWYLETMQAALQGRDPGRSPQDTRIAAARLVATIEGLSSVHAAARAMGVSREELGESVVAMADAVPVRQ
jgi:AcrR family transcriptional regulator